MAPRRFQDWILYEDDDIYAVNKPAGLSSLDERNAEAPNMLRNARNYWPESQLCHRLDKETSGILLIAKNPEAYRHMSIGFESREVKKVYHAVVDGVFSFNNLKVELPIYSDGGAEVRIDKMKGKPSVTIFNTLRFYNHFTLVDCRPVTGRMHQIRIHLASQNAPITNDLMYGGKAPFLSTLKRKFKIGKYAEEQPMIRRVALHARELEFTPPSSAKKIRIEAPYPDDMEVFIKLLEKYDT